MEIFFGFLATLALIFGFLGVIHPRITIKPPFARTRKRVFGFYSAVFFVSIVASISLQTPPSPEELEARRVKRVATLDAEVRQIPASNAIANLNAYQELLRLEPESELYKAKVEHYKPLAEKQRQAKAAATAAMQAEQARIQVEKAQEAARIRTINEERVRKHGPAPTNSAWDGSVLEVKEYIRSVAKDPGSVKYEAWGPVKYSDDRGWAVQCDWRAKNSFGGYVRDINTFYIQFGRVVAVE